MAKLIIQLRLYVARKCGEGSRRKGSWMAYHCSRQRLKARNTEAHGGCLEASLPQCEKVTIFLLYDILGKAVASEVVVPVDPLSKIWYFA